MSSYTHFTDDELLKRLRAGDEQAFTEIYHRYWEKLLAIGFFHLQDKQSAEDVVHEVFISVWVRKADVVIASLPAYLGTAVKFAVFKSIIREKRRREIMNAGASALTTTTIEDNLDAKFMTDFLHGKVEQLPEKARIVFGYSRGHELSVKEIAQKMDLSPKAVEYHLTKALRALKTSLKKIKILFV